MEATSMTHLNHEVPPDPRMADAAARQARRLLAASQGIFLCGLGIYAAIALLPILLYTEDGSDSRLIGLWLAFVWGIIFELALLHWILRWRKKSGWAVVGINKLRLQPPLKDHHAIMLSVGIALLGGLLEFLYEMQPPEKKFNWSREVWSSGYALLGAFLSLWRFLHLRFWEDLLLAMACLVWVVLVIQCDVHMETALLVPAGAATLAGFSLHLRWRRWVQALPKANGASATGEPGS